MIDRFRSWIRAAERLVVLTDAVGAAVERSDVVLVAGTSAVVDPVATLPQLARRRQERVAEITIDLTALSAGAVRRGPADELLPALEQGR